jgi:predicted ATP-grasp superfamily ATP-dependent carboligase
MGPAVGETPDLRRGDLVDSWRTGNHVLVTDTDGITAIAAIRDLGAAGYTVFSTSTLPDALGGRSTYARLHAQSPPYDTPDRFADWLDAFVRQHAISLIVPASDNFIFAIHTRYDTFADRLPTPAADAMYKVVNKHHLFSQFDKAPDREALRAHLPPYALLDDMSADVDADGLFHTLGGPLYLKVGATSAKTVAADEVFRCDTPEHLRRLLPDIRGRYDAALVQGVVRGRAVGVFLLVWDGEVRARFMHERLHEVPHTGGVSSYRQSMWNQDIYEDAVRRLRYLHWRGAAMLEYKWDPQTNGFWLLEINGRLWGSLHLALKSGVRFPSLLADTFYGRPGLPPPQFRVGVRCRYTFPLEVEYVKSCLRDRRLPLWRRCWCVAEFFLLSANPRVKSDLFYRRDNRLYWIHLGRWLGEFAGDLRRRLTRRAAPGRD